MNTAFDDMPDDLDFAPGKITPMTEAIAAQRFVPASNAAVFSSPCKKCNGRGKFVSYSGRVVGDCFVCKGSGQQTFKTSPEARAKAKLSAVVRVERSKEAAVEAFAAEHRAVHAWLVAKAPTFGLAASFLEGVRKFGSLTAGQLACAERLEKQDAERAAAKAAEPAPVARAVERLDALHSVMQRHAKFYAGEMTLSRRNQDQLVWIKHANAEKVVGKIDNGALSLWSRAGVDMTQVRDMLEEFNGAPLQSAMKYGRLSGRCCSCGRDLTDENSIEAGIGPVCAKKFAD